MYCKCHNIQGHPHTRVALSVIIKGGVECTSSAKKSTVSQISAHAWLLKHTACMAMGAFLANYSHESCYIDPMKGGAWVLHGTLYNKYSDLFLNFLL